MLQLKGCFIFFFGASRKSLIVASDSMLLKASNPKILLRPILVIAILALSANA